jgi:hypothetical protein
MYDEMPITPGGIVKPKKPKSRAEKVKDWKATHQAEYKRACDDHCTCTPSRAQMLLIEQWDNPPVD